MVIISLMMAASLGVSSRFSNSRSSPSLKPEYVPRSQPMISMRYHMSRAIQRLVVQRKNGNSNVTLFCVTLMSIISSWYRLVMISSALNMSPMMDLE